MQIKDIETHIATQFKAFGWAEETVKDPRPLNQIFVVSYALVGVLIAEGLEAILEDWRMCQDYIYELRDSGRVGKNQDSYLVLVLPRLGSNFDKLREALEDTHVCRKICIEIGDRTIEEAMMELPFFTAQQPASETMNEAPLASSSEVQGTLSTILLDDLAASSAEIVLGRLLRGDYDREVAH